MTTSTQKTITLEQTASAIGRPGPQRETLKGLGLNRIGRRSHVVDTPCQPRHDRQGRASRARRRRSMRIAP